MPSRPPRREAQLGGPSGHTVDEWGARLAISKEAQGYSNKSIAIMLETSESTVKSILRHHALNGSARVPAQGQGPRERGCDHLSLTSTLTADGRIYSG